MAAPISINELVPIEGFTVGRIVHAQLKGKYGGECRAAIIVRAWDARTGSANLSVFTDSLNDSAPPVVAEGSINHRRMGNEWGNWHWPQECIGG